MPSETMVRAYVEAIPPGEQRSVSVMRSDLARDYDAAITCPVTTGIHVLALAEAGYRDPDSAAPVWRVLDPKATVVKKLSFDPAWLWERQRDERVR